MIRFVWLLLLIPSLVMADDFDTPQTRLVGVQTRIVPAEPTPIGMVWQLVAQPSDAIASAAKNAVIVDFPAGDGSGSRGSGVYLGDRYVATAYHVVRGMQPNGAVTFRDGSRIRASVAQTDPSWDQAILQLESEHPSLAGVEMASQNPNPGERLYSVGFGQGFRVFGGSVVGFTSNGSRLSDWVEHQNPAVSGDSGGPMFTESGQLVGCLWGQGGGKTVGTSTGRFRIFVKPLFPRIAQWRANRIARQIDGVELVAPSNCPNGQCQPQFDDGTRDSYQNGGPQTPVPDPIPDAPVERVECPPGPKGDKGDPGKDGKDGEVTEQHLSSIVAAVVANLKADPSMRGPKGDAGPMGQMGPPGPTGPPGQSVTPEQLASLKAELLAEIQHPNIRVVIGNGGKIVDDETYRPGEPIVLDIEALVRAANAN